LRGWDAPAALFVASGSWLVVREFSLLVTSRWSLATSYPHQPLRLRQEAPIFLSMDGVPEKAFPVLLRPADGLVIPLAGLLLLAQLPVGHGQEQVVEGVAALAQGHRLVQRLDGGFPVAGTVMGHPQRVPHVPCFGSLLEGLLRQFDRPLGIAKL